jgi:hypothetical protein
MPPHPPLSAFEFLPRCVRCRSGNGGFAFSFRRHALPLPLRRHAHRISSRPQGCHPDRRSAPCLRPTAGIMATIPLKENSLRPAAASQRALFASSYRLSPLFLKKIAKNIILFLTMHPVRLISNFGVNSLPMSVSSELEPYPRCLGKRRCHSTAWQNTSARALASLRIVQRLLQQASHAPSLARGAFTTG